MAGSTREQTLSLLSTAKNHGDLAVKLSSLKQVKEILVSVDPSFAAELLPYVIELHMSPESLVRRFVVELMEEIGVKVMEQSSLFVPVLLTLLKDDVSFVVRQTIVSSTNFFCSVLKQMALQFRQCGKVERSCEELWMWMIKLKDAIHGIALTPGSIGTRLLAIKFLEIHILLVTPDVNDSESSNKAGNGRTFDKSWVADGHPILDAALLTLEAKRSLNLLLDTLQSANILCGSLIIAVVNW
ncbi:hypothetical protein GIB67_015205 [Kingdonia uniflora]|uniref:Symplekin/Pta1 N-terminal domain-containing protein n=1 Tax=Kingdonia uniflora TaxID=39325 RepID=A0A7J7MSH6_9MAGN|nr:hypothetical protein GIB67_015205 [Kingdonia uniflora]